MREPLQWSIPIGRLFRATVRIHILLPIVLLGVYLRALKDFPKTEGIALAAGAVLGLTFLSILLHEFGHVFAARSVGGDCDEVILWPLGGLALCSLPDQARAHFLTSLAGPLVNLMLCVLSAAFLVGQGIWPPLNPLTGGPYTFVFERWTTGEVVEPTWHLLLAARLFWLNWVLFWFNLLPAYPLDGGQMLHAVLWSRGDDREATVTTAYISFGVMLILVVVAIYQESVLLFALCVFIYDTCRRKLIVAETGSEEGGFDYGAGIDREAVPRRPRLSTWKRWKQRRAAERAHAEQQQREREEQRMDELLEKVQQYGLQSLSEEERRFLHRVSNRYRNRS